MIARLCLSFSESRVLRQRRAGRRSRSGTRGCHGLGAAQVPSVTVTVANHVILERAEPRVRLAPNDIKTM